MMYETLYPFWNQLSESEKTTIEEKCQRVTFKKGEKIYNSEDNCLGLVTIKEGMLRIYTVSDSGKEITLYQLFSYDTCLFSASCMMKNIQFSIAITAIEDTEMLVLPPLLYDQLRKSNIYFSNFINDLMESRFSEVMWLMDQVLHKKMDSRIAAFLLEEQERACGDIEVTHEDIARNLGTAREVVSRMLKYLEKMKMISILRKKIIILDVFALEKLAEESRR